ncbi:flagellar biosynthesis protein FlhF [bacterium]|nr:flagellar biosynthesis protein FlhF [bacterium]
MTTRTFRAATMKEALAAVKAEMGADAVILSTRSAKSLSGLIGRPGVEVTAARSADARPAPARAPEIAREIPRAPEPSRAAAAYANARAASEPESEPEPRAIATPDDDRFAAFARRLDRLESHFGERSIDERLSRMSGQIEMLAAAIATLGSAAPPAMPEMTNGGGFASDLSASIAFRNLYEKLIAEGVIETMAFDIVEEARGRLGKAPEDEFLAMEHVAAAIMDRVRVVNPFSDIGRKQAICAVVGPTGSGKTTTIAKLAAAQVFNRGKKAAFVTVDTFRIGAVEQLRTYARIMSAPLDVAVDEDDLAAKIARHADKDAIFIDTAGVSQKDTRMVKRLAGYFANRPQIDLHLIVPATTQHRDLKEVVASYDGVTLSSLIATKLDEANALGGVFNIAGQTGLPLSYFTIGQHVPDDIEAATRERVVDRLLGITTH